MDEFQASTVVLLKYRCRRPDAGEKKQSSHVRHACVLEARQSRSQVPSSTFWAGGKVYTKLG
jgi:hypothetical protein